MCQRFTRVPRVPKRDPLLKETVKRATRASVNVKDVATVLRYFVCTVRM